MKCFSLKSSCTRIANNQRGQIGIFVALIFQVIFVFFAMLINVGLIVHHKINLQQSADLAAYYGAMKQAEVLNAMAHVNYQMRQAWKLLAWRYRILGTFGYDNKGTSSDKIEYPMKILGSSLQYNPASENFKCPSNLTFASGLTMSDFPTFCIGHGGFQDWNSQQGASGNETQCKASCDTINGAKSSIGSITGVGAASILGTNNGVNIQKAIDATNQLNSTNCNELAPKAMAILASFYRSYFVETQNRKDFIRMLNRNLLLSEDEILDLEGKKIITGSKNTFENNLTEANKSGLIKFETLNGTKGLSENNLLNEINFKYLQFFIHRCETPPNNINASKDYSLVSIFENGVLRPALADQADQSLRQVLQDVFNNNNENFNTIGFEKNPWYQVYYGVKAVAEPKIPFLPIAKIKLHAISFAKPFGGSIGPWYLNNWHRPPIKSSFDGDQDYNKRVDKNLPRISVTNDASLTTPIGSRDTVINYSNYVGDSYSNEKGDGLKGGLANNQIVAFYHAMLMNKFVPNENSPASKNKTVESTSIKTFNKPSDWPRFSEWSHLTKELTDPLYDPLALNNLNPNNPRNTFMRDLEISAIAPNQFDLAYYSIDPNFYQTYFKERLEKDNAFQNLQAATGITVKAFPKDFGFNEKLAQDQSIAENFSIRHQLQVVNDIFRNKMNDILGVNPGITIQDKDSSGKSYFFTYIPKFQSSLLTGWSFNDFKDYNTFPSPSNDKTKYTMHFGTCADTWMQDNNIPQYGSPVDQDKPTVPGNCVTGGRTGYSVKIISSEVLQSTTNLKSVGGIGKDGPIENTVPNSFLSF